MKVNLTLALVFIQKEKFLNFIMLQRHSLKYYLPFRKNGGTADCQYNGICKVVLPNLNYIKWLEVMNA
jgi:hypothetical protein